MNPTIAYCIEHRQPCQLCADCGLPPEPRWFEDFANVLTGIAKDMACAAAALDCWMKNSFLPALSRVTDAVEAQKIAYAFRAPHPVSRSDADG